MNYFDTLPIDVIRDCIFPYLDYDGRNAVNAYLLPKKDYIRTQLIPKQVIRVHMTIIAHIIRYSMNLVEYSKTPYARRRALLKVFRTIQKYPLILQYSTIFRKMVEYKCTIYGDPNYHEYVSHPKCFIKKMCELCKNILLLLNTTYKYVECVSTIKNTEDFSAIQAGYTSYKPDLFTQKRFL